MRLRPELIIGIALVVVAFLALFLVANIINPPSQLVLVAIRDIQPGERLSPELARAVEVELPFVDSFILEAEADQFEGAVFIEAVHQNEPIHKASLVDADNPAAISRSSLALDDPNLVAFRAGVSGDGASGHQGRGSGRHHARRRQRDVPGGITLGCADPQSL